MVITVGEVKSSTVVNILQKEISYSFHQEQQFCTSILENHLGNSCKSKKNVITYNKRVVSTNTTATKGGYNFSTKVAQRMTEPGRKVPVQIMDDVPCSE